MRVILQRVKEANVSVYGEVLGEIKKGFLLYVGFKKGDTFADVEKIAAKILKLRVFEDDNDKMNLSIKDMEGSILSISQFTVYGSTKKGNRPSFTDTMEPTLAAEFYEAFNSELKKQGTMVIPGSFGAHMEISSINDGPVTFILESEGA